MITKQLILVKSKHMHRIYEWLICMVLVFLMILILKPLHQVVLIWNVWHWIIVYELRVQVLRIWWIDVENYDVYYCKIRVRSGEFFQWSRVLFVDIQDEPILAVDWSTTLLSELDISSTDLSEEALLMFFTLIPNLTYLAAPFCDGFTDKVSVGMR